MVEKDILKKILSLRDLPDHMLEKIGAQADIETYDEKTVLLKQNQEQTFLYMLVSGKVFLTHQSASGTDLTLEELSAGQTFGISAVMDESPSLLTAICSAPSTIIRVSGEKIRQLCEKDFEIGHIFMHNMGATLKSRSEMHTQQFLSSLASHPEIR